MATLRTAPGGNPYARLGLAPGASLADVKRAYRRLSMCLHPDRAGADGLAAFLAVQSAYQCIIARPSFAEPGDRRPSSVSQATPAGPARPATPLGPAAPVPCSGWRGGSWYWEAIRERARRP
jgi:hypothetical protein